MGTGYVLGKYAMTLITHVSPTLAANTSCKIGPIWRAKRWRNRLQYVVAKIFYPDGSRPKHSRRRLLYAGFAHSCYYGRCCPRNLDCQVEHDHWQLLHWRRSAHFSRFKHHWPQEISSRSQFARLQTLAWLYALKLQSLISLKIYLIFCLNLLKEALNFDSISFLRVNYWKYNFLILSLQRDKKRRTRSKRQSNQVKPKKKCPRTKRRETSNVILQPRKKTAKVLNWSRTWQFPTILPL